MEAQCGEDKVSKVEEREGQREGRLAGMVAPVPPVEGDGEHLGAGTEAHVEETGYGEGEVVADGVGTDALAGEGLEAGVEGGGGVVGEVVFVEEFGGAGVLGLRVEGTGGDVGDVDGCAVVVPVDVVGGGEVDAPGAEPVLEAEGDELAGIGGVARC